ncbi:thiamine-phosphate kinase [Sulfurimonas paralvinellae]|uniref:Thiamine-monophosphate kinase n=1 Tax=Sulfurimonas paralvinellae TaxID=317658 RepID=A0A7M1B774_9BACT|nr:thiamine-phosphate kinase [Sulfurimonas paralvinellae]QOP45599.1 thiamine-phosphate kinase [Sulfurimonas paralvinellae]
MNLENYFISLFNNNHIGDDAAVIEKYVYSKDAFFEDVHFKKKWMNYFQIAKKAMLVNISDAIAMNAQPMYALLSVAMPKSMTKKDMQALAAGFKFVEKCYNMEIIGGDTISNTKLDITITVISKTERPLLRKGMRGSSLLAYTGELGRSAKDLKRLFRGGKIHQKSKFVDIELREAFVKRAARALQAGMDISDGLFSDLDKMLKANGLGVEFITKIPKSMGCSGEEYEMLIAFDKRNLKGLQRRAKQSRTKLTVFAKASRKRYTNRCKAHHF